MNITAKGIGCLHLIHKSHTAVQALSSNFPLRMPFFPAFPFKGGHACSAHCCTISCWQSQSSVGTTFYLPSTLQNLFSCCVVTLFSELIVVLVGMLHLQHTCIQGIENQLLVQMSRQMAFMLLDCTLLATYVVVQLKFCHLKKITYLIGFLLGYMEIHFMHQFHVSTICMHPSMHSSRFLAVLSVYWKQIRTSTIMFKSCSSNLFVIAG